MLWQGVSSAFYPVRKTRRQAEERDIRPVLRGKGPFRQVLNLARRNAAAPENRTSARPYRPALLQDRRFARLRVYNRGDSLSPGFRAIYLQSFFLFRQRFRLRCPRKKEKWFLFRRIKTNDFRLRIFPVV